MNELLTLRLRKALLEIAKAVGCKKDLLNEYNLEDVITTVQATVAKLETESARVAYWKAACNAAEALGAYQLSTEGIGDETECLLALRQAEEEEEKAKYTLNILGVTP